MNSKHLAMICLISLAFASVVSAQTVSNPLDTEKSAQSGFYGSYPGKNLPVPDFSITKAQPDNLFYSCVCVDQFCGNNAIGSSNGTVLEPVPVAYIIPYFGPDRVGSQRTGWACRVIGFNSCVCVDQFCGNGAVGGSNGQVFEDLSTQLVTDSFGPDQVGQQRTGWACIATSI